MKNIHSIDRYLRIAFGIIALELGFFWLAGSWQFVAYGVGGIALVTAIMRFCPVYRVLGISTVSSTSPSKLLQFGMLSKTVAILVLLMIALAGSYGSAFLSRKVFIEDFNAMNHFYKQTLFLTGKNERDAAIASYTLLTPAFATFQSKYAQYRPYALKADSQFTADLGVVSNIFMLVKPLIVSGDLHQAHLDLEQVRPVFQDMFKRNGFSMLAIGLVDFHDAMELVLDAANAKDAAKVTALYPQVSDKLKTVESQANDAEIQAIRANLDAVLSAAQSNALGTLPAKADALKSSFVKVYLKRG